MSWLQDIAYNILHTIMSLIWMCWTIWAWSAKGLNIQTHATGRRDFVWTTPWRYILHHLFFTLLEKETVLRQTQLFCRACIFQRIWRGQCHYGGWYMFLPSESGRTIFPGRFAKLLKHDRWRLPNRLCLQIFRWNQIHPHIKVSYLDVAALPAIILMTTVERRTNFLRGTSEIWMQYERGQF